MKRIAMGVMGAALLVLTLAGCDSANTDDEAPPMLSAEAFSLQTTLFQDEGGGKTAQGPHFTAAALRVWPVSVVVSAHLVVPVVVTAAALQADPQQNGGTWTWTSTTESNGRPVTFTLSATPQGSVIRWSMRISLFDGRQTLDDFELYTAETDLAARTGSWQLYYRLDGQRTNVLNAGFTLTSDTQKRLVFNVPESTDRRPDDTVQYETDGDARLFFWQQADLGLEHLVTWSAATRAGSITATNYNGGEKACWDENLANADC